MLLRVEEGVGGEVVVGGGAEVEVQGEDGEVEEVVGGVVEVDEEVEVVDCPLCFRQHLPECLQSPHQHRTVHSPRSLPRRSPSRRPPVVAAHPAPAAGMAQAPRPQLAEAPS